MKTDLMSKNDVQHNFLHLLESYKRKKSQILTKEELAKDAENRKLVQEVANHTSENIVKGLAQLQLELGSSVESLSKRLQTELKTLENLRSAIKVQENNLQDTLNAKQAANALHILKLEQAQRLQQLEDEQKKTIEQLEKEQTKRRAAWAKAQEEAKLESIEYQNNLIKNRKKEAEDFSYALARKYHLEEDAYHQEKKLLLRSLDEAQKLKENAWKEREIVLENQQIDLNKYKQKVDNLEKEIEEKSKEAREKSIKQTSKECKDALELLEREIAGKTKVSDIQLNNLENVATQQKSEINQLSTELKDALAQVQQLSMKALEANKK